MGMESLTERHTKKGPSMFWLPDTGLENSDFGWEDHSPKFQMCFFLLFSALCGVTKFPIFCELVTPLHWAMPPQFLWLETWYTTLINHVFGRNGGSVSPLLRISILLYPTHVASLWEAIYQLKEPKFNTSYWMAEKGDTHLVSSCLPLCNIIQSFREAEVVFNCFTPLSFIGLVIFISFSFWLKFSIYQLQVARSAVVLMGNSMGPFSHRGRENICSFHVWMPGFRGQGWRLWGSGRVSGCKQYNEWQSLTSSFCLFSTGNIAVQYNELGLRVLNTSSLASEAGNAFPLLTLNCIFIWEEIMLRSSLMAPSRGKPVWGPIAEWLEKKKKEWPAFVQEVEGLSCLNWKGSEEAIMLSK